MTKDNTTPGSQGADMCEAKRGFFTLYDCGKPSAVVCTGCKRPLCAEHHPEKLSVCLECEAKKHGGIDFPTVEKDYDTSGVEEKPLQNLLAAYKNRQQSLSKEKGKAIYLGKNLNDYYKPYDLRSFDIELSNIADLSDSPDEVFFDS